MPDTSYHIIEQTLKAAASKGDQKAFKEIFDHYQHRLYEYIFRMVKSKEIAEELVIDVFMKLWNGREMLQEIENLNGFLFRVAYTKTIDFFRSAAANKNFVDLVEEQISAQDASNAFNELVSKEYDEMLRKAIALMPPKRKMIYEMSRDHNLSHEEIAGRLGISKSTVANTIVEAKAFITEYLSKDISLLTLIPLLFLRHLG